MDYPLEYFSIDQLNSLQAADDACNDISFSGAAAVNDPLGNNYGFCVRTAEEQPIVPKNGIERRYWLQSLARELLPNDRVCTCMHHLRPGAHGVDVRYSAATGTASYANLMVCGSVWCCPVCAIRITEQRRKELTRLIASAAAQGLFPILITYTLQHSIFDKLPDVVAALIESMRSLKNGRRFQRIKEEWGWVGSVKSLEVTFGVNGWHAHAHEMPLLDSKLTLGQLEALKKEMFELYKHALGKHGRSASSENGLDIRTADSDIAEYVAKFGHEPTDNHNYGWGVDRELTKAPVKQAHKDGMTPFELLAAYGGDNAALGKLETLVRTKDTEKLQQRAGELYRSYAASFKGRRQLVWSKGLKERMGMDEPEVSDEEAAAAPEPQAVTVATLLPRQWNRIRWSRTARGELLRVASAGDLYALRAWLLEIGIDALIYDLVEEFKANPDRDT